MSNDEKQKALNLEVGQAMFQKFKTDHIGIPNTSDAVYYTQQEADAYNALLTGALDSTTPLTAEQAAAYNEAITGASKQAGDTLSTAEANAYNATLDGAVSTSSIKTPAVPKKVKTYVDDKAATLVSDVSYDSTSGKIKKAIGGTTSDVVEIYTKAQIDAQRAIYYNSTTKAMVVPATSDITYNSSTKAIVLTH